MYSIDLALISLRGEKTAPKMADTLLDLPNLLGTLHLPKLDAPTNPSSAHIIW